MMNSVFKSSKQLAVALSLCALSFGVQATAGEELHSALLPDYIAASDGDRDAFDRAFEGYEQWVKKSPESPTAQVYYGGVLALKGRDAWMPWNKMKHTEKGLDIMAKAVDLIEKGPAASDERALAERVDVLSLAGINFTQVPDMFGRFEEGYDLLQGLVGSEDLLALPIEAVSHVYFFAGQAAEKNESNDQAIEYYKTMLDRGATGANADKAKQSLAALAASK